MRSRRQCSMCPAIHINSRSWLRSSSTHEPSDPPLRVMSCLSSRPGPATERSGKRPSSTPGADKFTSFHRAKKKERGGRGRPPGTATNRHSGQTTEGYASSGSSNLAARKRLLSRANEAAQVPPSKRVFSSFSTGSPSRGPRRLAPPCPRGRTLGSRRAEQKRAQAKPIRRASVMILPQVHLRKPCYDFYFL